MQGRLDRFVGMSVLIVDDNASNVALLEALVQQAGLRRVYTETDSRQVPAQLLACRPDLIMLDLHMPHVDGLAVLAQIREFAAGEYLPVLVLTADTTARARDEALSYGAHDFLSKPIDGVEVILRVANLLEARELHTNLRRANLASGLSAEPAFGDPEAVRRRIEGVLHGHGIRQVYQPIFDTNNLTAVGYEGLSRFADTSGGAPDRWFEAAFTVGRGVDLEWVAAKAMLKLLELAPDPTFLAINMSPATVLHLRDHELCPKPLCPRLVIEITEHVPIEDYAAVHAAFSDMRGYGARLAADDLGAGYAGFRHLISLSPDIIKLDISLVRGIHRSAGQQALANALVTFAADVGARVIAEGVEEEAELDVLRDMGVSWAQGFHLGRPQPLPRVLRRRRSPSLPEPIRQLNDQPGSHRPQDDLGDLRDLRAGRRDAMAHHRDAVSQQRDDAAAKRDAAAAAKEARELPADDAQAPRGQARRHAAHDRNRGASDRQLSSEDRAHSLADRIAARKERKISMDDRASAMLDELTGALRRGPGLFELNREMARARRIEQDLVLAFVDVDGLKNVNDSRGHDVGDAILQTVCEALKANVRPYDPVARLGGAEFICVLSGMRLAEARARLVAVNQTLLDAGEAATVTIGLAMMCTADSPATLIKRADDDLCQQRTHPGERRPLIPRQV